MRKCYCNSNDELFKCKECKKREYHRVYYKNKIKVRTEEEYRKEFFRVTSMNGKFLTIKGFDEEAHISAKKIVRGLDTSWKCLLEEYNKIDGLFKYVVSEYIVHAHSRGKANSTVFVKEHPYINQTIFWDILDSESVRASAGFINENYNGSYNDHLLRKHFNEVRDRLNCIPTVSEFSTHGNILPSIYCDYYGIKGQMWDEVLDIMISDKEELNEFFKRRTVLNREKAIDSLRNFKMDNRIPDKVLEEEFKRVFEFFFTEFGTHPTRRLFNKNSIFNDMTYRKRHKMKWSEIATFYGFTLKERKVAEKIFLEIIKKIVSSNYQREKTWDWLIGVKGKHLFCDGYFEELYLVVELDGKHHRTPVINFGGYERFLRDQENDAIKERLVKEHGYKFLRVSTKESWDDESYVLKRLQNVGVNISPLEP